MENEEKLEPVAESETTEAEVISEIIIRAKNDGNVTITMPNESNIWVIRGILAKAFDAVVALEINKN